MQSLFPDKTIGKLLDHICAVGGQSHSPDSRGPRKKEGFCLPKGSLGLVAP